MSPVSTPDRPPKLPVTRRFLTRRRMLRATGAAAVTASLAFAWTYFVEPFWFELSQRDLPIPNLPPALTGKRLLHLSDLHLGKTDPKYLDDAIDHAASLDYDMVALTGDIISTYARAGGLDALRLLSRLKPAPLGGFACLGNHDYGRNWREPRVGDEIAMAASDAGLRTLSNESLDVHGLDVVGLDDLWAGRMSIRPAFADTRPDLRPTLVLCHNPDALDLPDWPRAGRQAILAGHTHGGQCKPPFLPAPMLPVKNRLYSSGYIPVDENRHLHISRGLGYLRQVRFNCRPEMTMFTLKPA